MPNRVEVLVLPTTASDQSLQRVLNDGDKANEETLSDDRALINDALNHALFALAPCVTNVDGLESGTIGQSVAFDALAQIQASHPAGVYLRLQVTDYGETPRQWRGTYIAFEVVTTAGIAAGLALHGATWAVAGVYVVQETVEEVSEGYAGFWTLNRLSRPVRIDADLIDGASGQVLWRDAETGLAPWRWRHLVRMDEPTRDELLATSMRKAMSAVVTNAARHVQFDCPSPLRE